MLTNVPDAAVAAFDAVERISGQTLDWGSIGDYVRHVDNSHDVVLGVMLDEINITAKMYERDSWQWSLFRAQHIIITGEQQARSKGKVPRYLTAGAKREQSVRERCERIHESINIEHFIERECGVTLQRGRCRCPVHDGDSPFSFSIRNGYGKCFVCGFGGDVIELARTVWGLPRPIDAVKRLERWG